MGREGDNITFCWNLVYNNNVLRGGWVDKQTIGRKGETEQVVLFMNIRTSTLLYTCPQ